MELIFLPLLFLAMWFVMIRPQQARVRAQRDLVASLEVGDRVVTAGGIVGTINVLDGGEVLLGVSPGVELTVLRGAVSRKLDPEGLDDDETGPDDGADPPDRRA